MAPSELDLSVELSFGAPLKSHCSPLIFRDSTVARWKLDVAPWRPHGPRREALLYAA